MHLGNYEETRPSAGSYATIQRVRASPGVVRVRRTAAAGSSATSGSRFEYLHPDHLGSLDRVTDGAGAAAATLAAASFDPFGGRREADWSSDAGAATRANVLALQAERFGRGFGDHEELSRTGFVHMNGRVFDPRLGRFLQPDPVVAAPHSSQGHNRYAYVLNRPLSLADPTGLTPVPPGAMALGMSPVDINAVILAGLWDYIGWAGVPVYQLSGFDSIIAGGLSNAGLNTYLKTKIRIEECLSGDCVEWIAFVERRAQHAARVPAWLWKSGYAAHMVAPGSHVYAHTSSEICRADEPGCTLENIVEALNAVGVHRNQTRPFVPGEPYVEDVVIPLVPGRDDVSTHAILDRLGRQVGVFNTTQQNHMLDLGGVSRGPVLIAGGYRIRTVSQGTGWWGFPNIVGGPVYWWLVDRRVIDRVRSRLNR